MDDEEDYCPTHNDELLFPHDYYSMGYCHRCKCWYWFSEIKMLRKKTRGKENE